MNEKFTKRLEELKTEFESGQKMLAELDAKRENLRETLLRISGAIQVLDEQLKDEDGGESFHNKKPTVNLASAGSQSPEKVNHHETIVK